MSKSRRAIAEQLVALQRRVEPSLLEIDGLKEQLREIAIANGEGFTEEIKGKGTVEVKGPIAPKLKGILPELKPETFLTLPAKRRETLIADGVVAMVEQWTRSAKPSVTVRL